MNMINSWVKKFDLSDKDISVYLPPVMREIKNDSRTTLQDVKKSLATHGLMLQDEHLERLLKAARYIHGFAQSI